jgi:hypothetical protein
MKKLSLFVALSAVLLGGPISAFAQANSSTAAGQSIHAVNSQVVGTPSPRATDSSYGGTTSGSSAAAMKNHPAMHACVGPVSFCNIYFGS